MGPHSLTGVTVCLLCTSVRPLRPVCDLKLYMYLLQVADGRVGFGFSFSFNDNHCLLIGVFSPVSFNMYSDIFGFKLTVLQVDLNISCDSFFFLYIGF